MGCNIGPKTGDMVSYGGITFIDFFYKSAVPGEEKNIMKIKDHNHKLTVLDIEGLVLAPEPIGAKRRYSNKNISKLDHVFFWGREDYNRAIKKFPKIKKKSSILGSHIVNKWKIFKKKNNLKKIASKL